MRRQKAADIARKILIGLLALLCLCAVLFIGIDLFRLSIFWKFKKFLTYALVVIGFFAVATFAIYTDLEGRY